MKIAIDPGWSGGLAVQFNNGKTEAIACPETQADMILFIRDYAASEEKKSAVIEKVHAMPGQGVSSTWKFAVNYATWQSALIAFHIPFVEVSPQSWQNVGVATRPSPTLTRQQKQMLNRHLQESDR